MLIGSTSGTSGSVGSLEASEPGAVATEFDDNFSGMASEFATDVDEIPKDRLQTQARGFYFHGDALSSKHGLLSYEA